MTEGAAVISRAIVERVLGPKHGFGPDGWESEIVPPQDGAAQPVCTTKRDVAVIVQFGWTTTRTSGGWRVSLEPIGVVISRSTGVERLVRPGGEPGRFPFPDETASVPVGAGDHTALEAIVRRCVATTTDGLVLRSFHAVLHRESGRLSEAARAEPVWAVRIRR